MTDHIENIKAIIENHSGKGQIRVNCFNCEGSQKDTLSINTETGVYHCFRCGIKGNALKNGFSDFSEKSAQDKAISMLDNSYPVNGFPYLQNKQIKAYNGIREYRFKNGERCLLIPVMNHHGEIVSVQIIKKNGDKQFLKGTVKKGNFFKILGNKKIFICEGYATACSVHEATGGTVYVAFDAGNISYVLEKIYNEYDEIVICADNDHKSEDNPGVSKAIAAALQYENVKIVYPADIQGTDFNDMFIEKGLQMVKDRIAQAKKPDKNNLSKIPENTEILRNLEILKWVLKRASDLEHIEFPPINWIVPGILPEGACLFAGKPKIGKSILALNIALSITTGTPALGQLPVEKGSAIYLSLDDTSERRLKERLSTMLQGKPFPDNLYYQTTINRMDKGGVECLKMAIESIPDLKLVIIDTLQRFRPLNTKKSANSTLYSEDYNTLSELNDLAIKHNIAILIVTHTRKAEAEDIFDMISGSLGLTAAVDTIMMMTKTTKTKGKPALHIRGRDVEENEYALSQEKDKKQWIITGELREVQNTEKKQLIIDCLKECGEAMTPTEIAESTEMKACYVKKTLPSLIQSELVEKVGHGKYQFLGTIGTIEKSTLKSEKAPFGKEDEKGTSEGEKVPDVPIVPQNDENDFDKEESQKSESDYYPCELEKRVIQSYDPYDPETVQSSDIISDKKSVIKNVYDTRTDNSIEKIEETKNAYDTRLTLESESDHYPCG